MAVRTKYGWKEGTRYKSDANKAGRHLAKLEKKHGQLTPQDVVDSARPVTSPIHKDFEWDDTVAAEKWRIREARNMMRCVIIMQDSDVPQAAPAFVNVIIKDDEDKDKQFYTTTAKAMSDTEMRAYVLRKALKQVRRWEKQYENYHELALAFEAFDTIEAQINDIFAELELAD